MDSCFLIEPCYFCGHKEVLVFNEHYMFCPNCTAIYTNMAVVPDCEHIEDNAMVCERRPWFKGMEVKPHIENETHCSVCGKSAIVLGW